MITKKTPVKSCAARLYRAGFSFSDIMPVRLASGSITIADPLKSASEKRMRKQCRLREVPGIGKKRIAKIRENWEQQKEIKNIMLFLQS